MAVDIYIFDRSRSFLKLLEQISPDTIQILTVLAERRHLRCASYIYYIGNTIFNQKQLPILKNEIEQLKMGDSLNVKDMTLILDAIGKAQQDKSLYLMFIGE